MRQTQAHLNLKMQDFCQKLFDKTDKLGYDVTIANSGETSWFVRIENLHSKDQYEVTYNPQTQEWSWIRWL